MEKLMTMIVLLRFSRVMRRASDVALRSLTAVPVRSIRPVFTPEKSIIGRAKK